MHGPAVVHGQACCGPRDVAMGCMDGFGRACCHAAQGACPRALQLCTVSALNAMRHASHGHRGHMCMSAIPAMHCCCIRLMGRQLCASDDIHCDAARPAQSCCRQYVNPAQPTYDLAALHATPVARMPAPAMRRTDAVCATPCKPVVDAMQLLDEARSDPSAVSFAVRPVEVVMARSHSRDATSFSSLDGQAAPVAVCFSAQANHGMQLTAAQTHRGCGENSTGKVLMASTWVCLLRVLRCCMLRSRLQGARRLPTSTRCCHALRSARRPICR